MSEPDFPLSRRVVEVVADVLEVGASELRPESSPDTVDGWDSIRHVDLMIALEQEFGVVFAAQEIEEADSVAAILRLVASKVRR